MSMYGVLQLPNYATMAEIKQSFKKLALELHPDKTNQSDSQAFIDVQKAYQYLTQNKQVYDSLLNMTVEGYSDLQDKLRIVNEFQIINGYLEFQCEQC